MSFSDPFIAGSVSMFRQIVAETGQTQSERSLLFQLGQDLVVRFRSRFLTSND